jgi:hypothetical protein
MTDELKALVEQAGCPEEVMNTLWFQLFINKFTDIIITECEKELS